MDIDSYAWLVYILTFLLTFSIVFILVLIVAKCVQTCIETRLFCFRKRRRRRSRSGRSNRRRRNENSAAATSQQQQQTERSCCCVVEMSLRKCCLSCIANTLWSFGDDSDSEVAAATTAASSSSNRNRNNAAGSSNNSNQPHMSTDDDVSSSYDDEDDDEDIDEQEYMQQHRVNLVGSVDHSSVFLSTIAVAGRVVGCDNHAFSSDLETSAACRSCHRQTTPRAQQSITNVVNRKYDDPNRFINGKRAAIVKRPPETQPQFNQPPPSYQISSISTNLVKYPTIQLASSTSSSHNISSPRRQTNTLPSMSILTSNLSNPNILLCDPMNINRQQHQQQQQCEVNIQQQQQQDSLPVDPDLTTDDEIPPSYEQVINESSL